MPITVRELTKRIDSLRQHYDLKDHLDLWRSVLEAIDQGAQDARLLAREALVVDSIRLGWASDES